MIEIFQEIYRALQRGRELVVVTIVSDRGSTPRTSGSRMLVYRDGSISGTIGGGGVEGDVIKGASNLFTTGGAMISSYNLNETGNADGMDLICGGRLQVLIEHIPVNEDNIGIYGTACDAIAMSRPFLLLGKVEEDGSLWRVQRAIEKVGDEFVGSLEVKRGVLDRLEMSKLAGDRTSLLEIEDRSYVVDFIHPPASVFIVGGGHVSREIAVLTKQVGFRTLVFDDRAEFANTKRFPDVDQVHVCPGFSGVFDAFHVNRSCYIIIVTRGHRFDREVLKQALQTKAGYIGMIGSRRKRETIYRDLLNAGVEQRALDKVYCPIGLPIAAETPAEIGVSVVAQLIQHRADWKKHG